MRSREQMAAVPPVDLSDMEARQEAYRLLHLLWGQAKDGEYDKAAWGRLQTVLRRFGVGTTSEPE